MRNGIILWFILGLISSTGFGQVGKNGETGILFRGIVKDAASDLPLSNTQIFINHIYIAATDSSGTFAFSVRTSDSILFSSLGYKPAFYHLGDSLSTTEIMAGIYMTSDTISIGEVIIIPQRPNLKSEILNTPVQLSPERENAKYNLQLAAYQGKVSQGKLGDPASNYNVMRQMYSQQAREKGQVSSSQMVSVSPFTIIPLAYMLLKGFPEKPAPFKANLTKEELDRIHKKYLESVRSTNKK
jgi:hypothetical protein